MKDNNTLQEKLVDIQKNLKVPKNNKNSFGNYNYRSFEDILEGVKPLLDGCSLVINDEVLNIGNRYYIKAIATLSDGKDSIVATAFAREAEVKKGMDEAQITGSASSYARKYALNGLFAIDDTKDADGMDNRDHQAKPQPRVEEEDGYVHEPYHGEAAAKPVAEHVCTIHGKPMKERTGKNGGSWYDHRWQVNGVWQQCNGTPKIEEESFDSYEN